MGNKFDPNEGRSFCSLKRDILVGEIYEHILLNIFDKLNINFQKHGNLLIDSFIKENKFILNKCNEKISYFKESKNPYEEKGKQKKDFDFSLLKSIRYTNKEYPTNFLIEIKRRLKKNINLKQISGSFREDLIFNKLGKLDGHQIKGCLLYLNPYSFILENESKQKIIINDDECFKKFLQNEKIIYKNDCPIDQNQEYLFINLEKYNELIKLLSNKFHNNLNKIKIEIIFNDSYIDIKRIKLENKKINYGKNLLFFNNNIHLIKNMLKEDIFLNVLKNIENKRMNNIENNEVIFITTLKEFFDFLEKGNYYKE